MGVGLIQKRVIGGLDTLVSRIEVTGPSAFWNLDQPISEAIRQLEDDDSLDARTSDLMLDLLLEAKELSAQGQSVTGLMEQLVEVYRYSRQSGSLEAEWRTRAAALTEEEIETELWHELLDTTDLILDGDTDSAREWLDETLNHFLNVWRGYELSVAVFEDEITTETVLCHRFLKQGLACWIRALEILKAGNFDPDKVLENAMEGQRLLVMVQIVEDEIAAAASKVFVHWN